MNHVRFFDVIITLINVLFKLYSIEKKSCKCLFTGFRLSKKVVVFQSLRYNDTRGYDNLKERFFENSINTPYKPEFKEKFSNEEARKWYVEQTKHIAENIDKSLSEKEVNDKYL